jgi:hypothetical protein
MTSGKPQLRFYAVMAPGAGAQEIPIRTRMRYKNLSMNPSHETRKPAAPFYVVGRY